MRRFYILLLLLTFALAPSAQTSKKTSAKQNRTTVVKKKTTTRKKATTRKKKNQTSGNKSIKGLRNERAQIKKQIAAQQQRLRNNERDVKKRLQNLMVINTEIDDKRKSIDTIRRDITALETSIEALNTQLDKLNKDLADKKEKYVKSMRYMHRNRSIQNQLMFIFSAKNFSQMYRRMRFMREYATYQKAQGEAVKLKQAEVTKKHDELTAAKRQKDDLLYRGEMEKRNLEGKQAEQQNVVATLKKQQRTIQKIISDQQKRDAAINEQIDRLVAIEVEKARQRAIAEAKRKAEEERKAREAAEAAERKANAKANKKADKKDRRRETAEARKKSESSLVYNIDSEDRRISGSFESNRGKLPMPITGAYKIVSHFGQYNVEGLSNVRLDNKGINILGSSGANARSIFDGEVSAVFNMGGINGVMVRHGSYISVYCNLASVSVHKGQKVKVRQVLGTIGQDNILQFQLRKEKAKLNPEVWLGR